jgi:hypothetical protein
VGGSVDIEGKYHRVQAGRIMGVESGSAPILLSYLQAGSVQAPPIHNLIMTTKPLMAHAAASRFVQHWLAAAPAREAELEALAELSLDQLDLADLLRARHRCRLPCAACVII